MPDSLPQSDPESAYWLWRYLPSGSGTCRTTTLRTGGGFMSFNATETYHIPPRGWRPAQQPPAIRSRIGQPVVEKSAIKFCHLHAIHNDNSQKDELFPEFWCHSDTLYTAGYLASSPGTSWSWIQHWLSGCGGGLQLWPGSVDIECCDEKRVSRHVQFEAKCREPTSAYSTLESVMTITHFQSGVSWHFRLFKDDVLNIEPWVPVGHGPGVFRTNLRLRVWWLAHQAPALTIFCLPGNTHYSHPG